MKDTTIKNIRLCCYVALALCVLWSVSLINYLIVDLFVDDVLPHPVDWSQKAFFKGVTLACYVVGSIAMIALGVKVALNILKGVRENTVFPKSNVKRLFWLALANFIYILGFENMSVLWDENHVFCLRYTNFVMPFLLLFFAFMYKVAADVAEENSLTI